MEPGTRVEVRSRFDRRWVRGFEIAEVAEAIGAGGIRYRIRRRSDGSVLPTFFDGDDVREEKRRDDMWWI